MSLATLLPFAIQGSVVLIVFALGLDARARDALSLFRQPSKLARSLLSMNVVMPVVAALMAARFDLRAPVEIALISLAVSPVPPILPKKELKAGGHSSYVFGLLGAAVLLAVVFVPVTVDVLGRAFGRTARVSPVTIARLALVSVLVPLPAGVAVRRLMPAAAAWLARAASLLGSVLLVVSVLPVLFTAWPAIVSLIGNGTILAIAAFVLIGLAIGQALGRPEWMTGPCSRCAPRRGIPASRWLSRTPISWMRSSCRLRSSCTSS